MLHNKAITIHMFKVQAVHCVLHHSASWRHVAGSPLQVKDRNNKRYARFGNFKVRQALAGGPSCCWRAPTIAISNVTPTADYSVRRASLHNFTNGLLNGNEESKQRLKVHTHLPVLKLSHKSEASAAVLSLHITKDVHVHKPQLAVNVVTMLLC